MEDNKAFWEATMGAAFAPFNLCMAFMACTGIGLQAAFLPPPDNTKRNRLLASLQHGLRDESPDQCDFAMSELAAEFGNQDLVYSCLMLSTIESFKIFGPELTYRIIENMGNAAPDSRVWKSTADMLVTLADYCEFNETARSNTFNCLSGIMNKAGISGSVLNRSREIRDYKITDRDVRQLITPTEFLGRFSDYRDTPDSMILS